MTQAVVGWEVEITVAEVVAETAVFTPSEQQEVDRLCRKPGREKE